jgi:hypothetical protein
MIKKKNSFGSKYVSVPTNNISIWSEPGQKNNLYLKSRHWTKKCLWYTEKDLEDRQFL